MSETICWKYFLVFQLRLHIRVLISEIFQGWIFVSHYLTLTTRHCCAFHCLKILPTPSIETEQRRWSNPCSTPLTRVHVIVNNSNNSFITAAIAYYANYPIAFSNTALYLWNCLIIDWTQVFSFSEILYKLTKALYVFKDSLLYNERKYLSCDLQVWKCFIISDVSIQNCVEGQPWMQLVDVQYASSSETSYLGRSTSSRCYPIIAGKRHCKWKLTKGGWGVP